MSWQVCYCPWMRSRFPQWQHVPQLQGSGAMDRREPASRECLFFAFDLLHLNGEDLWGLPLVERKAGLKRLLRRKPSAVSMSITSRSTARGCSRRRAVSTWRALSRSGRTHCTGQRRSRRRTGSRSRTATTHKPKGGRNFSNVLDGAPKVCKVALLS